MKFTTLLRSVILEQQSKFQILYDKLTKPSKDKEGNRVAPKLSEKEFFELMSADPTTRTNNVDLQSASKEELETVKAGKYTPWIIKWYLTPEVESKPGEKDYEKEVKEYKRVFIEDLPQINKNLQKFDRFKSRIEGERDLNKLDPHQLYDAVKDFSLEKTKATAEEKQKAQQTFEHPGAEIMKRGDTWTLVRISDKGELGRSAACFYGGNQLGAEKGESSFCTSAPGYAHHFNTYIQQGPLYVIIKNQDTKFGEVSKLPATRYQFHFPSNQFKDTGNGRNIDLVQFLNGPAKELKESFRPEFAKGLSSNSGKDFKLEGFSRGLAGTFVALYGLNEIFEGLSENLESLTITNPYNENVKIKVPESISKFKNLDELTLQNCISEIPNSICKLSNLRIINLEDNKNLKNIPECIVSLPNIMFLDLKGCENVQVPQSIQEKGFELGDNRWDLT